MTEWTDSHGTARGLPWAAWRSGRIEVFVRVMLGVVCVGCGVMEWVKGSTLRWFGHNERMGNEEFVKKVYRSSVEGTNRTKNTRKRNNLQNEE